MVNDNIVAKSSIELMRLITKRNSDTGNKYKVGESASHIIVDCVYKVTGVWRVPGQPPINYKLGDTLEEEEVETLRRAALVRVTIT